MGTVSFNGVLLFAHALLLFYLRILLVSFYCCCSGCCCCCSYGAVKCMPVFSISCDRWILLPRMAKSCQLYRLHFLLFFELHVISWHSHNVATMICAHKSEWHSFCLLTIVAIVATMPMLIVLISGWWPCFHARKTSIACLPPFFFCATINSYSILQKQTLPPHRHYRNAERKNETLKMKATKQKYHAFAIECRGAHCVGTHTVLDFQNWSTAC